MLLTRVYLKKLSKSDLAEATMFSNASDHSGLKTNRSCLKLRRRQESTERQNQARDDVVEDLRTTTEDSSESAIWIDDHFKRVIKKLVHSFIEAENQLYGLQDRKKRLESLKSDGKVPSGLKISVVAKGQSAQNLQEKFNIITKETELKLLDATIEALNSEEQQAKERCKEEKKNVDTTIESWKESFQTSASLDVETDDFVKSAKCFADNFYFECAATRASKHVSEKMRKAAKEAKRTEKMETEFISLTNSQSVTWSIVPCKKKFQNSARFLRLRQNKAAAGKEIQRPW